MFSRNADGPLVVQVPGPAQDRPSWKRVGIIAATGFLIGIAWPRLAGVRLGPSLPDVPSASASATLRAMPSPSGELLSGASSGRAAAPAVTAAVGVPAVTASSAPVPKPVGLAANARTGTASASASARADVADGTAQVVWEVALVRDAPKTGKVVTRLQRGVTIRIGPVKDGWYPVRYGSTFASEGWVYRGAIGR